MRSHINQQLGTVVGTCHPSDSRECKIGGLLAKSKTHLQNNPSKKGLEAWLK
jgi:hypothetical protein